MFGPREKNKNNSQETTAEDASSAPTLRTEPASGLPRAELQVAVCLKSAAVLPPATLMAAS